MQVAFGEMKIIRGLWMCFKYSKTNNNNRFTAIFPAYAGIGRRLHTAASSISHAPAHPPFSNHTFKCPSQLHDYILGLACFSSPSRHHLSVTQVPAISTGSQRQTPIPILSLSSALGTLSVRNTVRSNLALCFTFTYTSTSFLVKIPDNFKLPPCTTHPRYRCRIRSSTPIQYNYPPDNKTCFLIHCHHYFHQPFQNKATKIVLDQPLHMFRVLKDSAWTSLLEPCPSVLKRARLSERLVLSSPGKGLRGRQPSILTLSYPETFPWQVT